MTTAVLLPCALGYCLFVRWPRQRLRSCAAIVDPSDLASVVGSPGDPLTVVLVGSRHVDAVSRAVLGVADLVVVPEPWLRRVPRTALSARAELATRIAAAHQAQAVQHRLRNDIPQEFPF